MEITRISLSERIESFKRDQTRQPEYIPCPIRQWAQMPIKAYFGRCTTQQQQLYRLLGLAPESDPPYQAVAAMVMSSRNKDHWGYLLSLLAAPLQPQRSSSTEGGDAQ